eukprot:scaffold1060_cov385-Pavlova_lutheri.AAC.22
MKVDDREEKAKRHDTTQKRRTGGQTKRPQNHPLLPMARKSGGSTCEERVPTPTRSVSSRV